MEEDWYECWYGDCIGMAGMTRTGQVSRSAYFLR